MFGKLKIANEIVYVKPVPEISQKVVYLFGNPPQILIADVTRQDISHILQDKHNAKEVIFTLTNNNKSKVEVVIYSFDKKDSLDAFPQGTITIPYERILGAK